MRWLRRFLARFANFATGRRSDQRFREEMEEHLAMQIADNLRTGMPLLEARRQAILKFGSPEAISEGYHSEHGLPVVENVLQDCRYAVRLLRKNPGFTFIAAASLALAIGANVTVFALARQLLFERLAVPHAEQLRLLSWRGTEGHVAVHHVWGNYDPIPDGRVTSTAFSYPVYQLLAKQERGFQNLFAFKRTGMNATIRGNAYHVRAEMVSGNYFTALEVRPLIGRLIEPSDDELQSKATVAVIGYGFWERAFDRSSAILGQTITLSNTTLTIIGVAPKGFTSAQDAQSASEIFVPLAIQPRVAPSPDSIPLAGNASRWWLNIMGRIRPGASELQAQATMNDQLKAAVLGTMEVKTHEDLPQLVLKDGSRGLFEQDRIFARPMAVLFAMVGFVLLVACANIANLTLARGAQRRREMSMRLALGARHARIIRQMLVESLMLAALGGLGGLATGYLGRNMIPLLLENAWERTGLHVHFDWQVFGFASGITVLTGLLFGLAPALTAARTEATYGLKNSIQAMPRQTGFGAKGLVAFQIALSTLLVIAAGLFLRTLFSLSTVDVGFLTDHLLMVEINPPNSAYPAGKDIELHQRLEHVFAALPGVKAISLAEVPYLSDEISRTDFLREGEHFDRNKTQAEYYNEVGNTFLETLSIPIVAGRSFGPQDTATSARVAIINQSLARKRFPNENPLGKRFTLTSYDSDSSGQIASSWIQIVGICADTRYANLRAEPPAQFLLPYIQQGQAGAMTYEIRTTTKPEAILPALRQVVRQIDPDLPIDNAVRTQDQQIAADMQQERIFVVLSSGFAVLALALACVGIYGVMAHSVVKRTNEIGIRLAFGAQPAQVRSMILCESGYLAITGTVAGVIAAVELMRLVTSIFYGVAPNDPVVLLGSVALLLITALAASWIPARSAAAVQPLEALRHD